MTQSKTTLADVKNFTKPEGSCLFFAGEHTGNGLQSIHGAIKPDFELPEKWAIKSSLGSAATSMHQHQLTFSGNLTAGTGIGSAAASHASELQDKDTEAGCEAEESASVNNGELARKNKRNNVFHKYTKVVLIVDKCCLIPKSSTNRPLFRRRILLRALELQRAA